MTALFNSFFIAGFECSTHKLPNGRRLDLLAATGHDRFAAQDFARLRQHGIATARSGVRWHCLETSPYHYDFSSLLPYLRAAREAGIQIIWDLCHYGYPDDLDIFSAEFVQRFTHFAKAAADVIAQETPGTLFFCPVNEMSFWAWAGGDAGYLNPFVHHRSFELKKQLVRATISAIDAIREIAPDARFTAIDPVIHITPQPDRPEDFPLAEGHRRAQFQAWDMLCGRLEPGLGGAPEYLDIIGVNYYANNQWFHDGETITPDHPQYRPFSSIAREVYQYYQRPMFIAETGTEGDARPDWLRMMMGEVRMLLAQGIPMEGLCLYPILCYPGWDDERHCPAGLWDYADADGQREVCIPLAEALREESELLQLLQA
jgi:beta-glucosidase/6-phospho-beta-glucosidase/beta-galactosidase